MAWVAGADVVTGDLINAAVWNNYMGVAGSLEYLKSQTDLMFTVTHDEPVRALDVIYQNSTKIRVVTVNVGILTTTNDSIEAFCENATPPTIKIFTLWNQSNAATMYLAGTLVVPANWYYEMVDVGGATLLDWHEWDLF